MAAPMDMLTANSVMDVHFPVCESDSRHTERQIFANCGTIGNLTGDSTENLISQRIQSSADQWHPVTPVLPVYFTNETTSNMDVVLDMLKEVNSIQREFAEDMIQAVSYKDRQTMRNSIRAIYRLEKLVTNYGHTGEIDLPRVNEEFFKADLGSLIKRYRDIKLLPGRLINNFKYTNGCLAFLPESKQSGHLLTPSGSQFSDIKLSFLKGDSDHVMHVEDVFKKELGHTIHGIFSQHVHDTDYIGVKTDSNCFMYSLNVNKNIAHKLKLEATISAPSGQFFRSLNISPYIPNEYCMTSESGMVLFWKNHMLETFFQTDGPSVGKLPDTTCDAHFGSHPRCVIFTNNSSVKLYDLRSYKALPKKGAVCIVKLAFASYEQKIKSPNVSPLNLYSLESSNGNEQIRVCQSSPASTFFHMVATDYSFILLDERFPKLPTMPQYISAISSSTENTVYIGSQYQPVVHRLSFKMEQNQPPQWIGIPRRIAKLSELTTLPSGCNDKLKERLNQAPLAGIKAVPYGNGHMVFQLNGLGDVFYQAFLDKDNLDIEDNPLSTTQGQSSVLNIKPGALKVTEKWIKRLEKEFVIPDIPKEGSTQKKNNSKRLFSSLREGMPGFIGCPMCMSVVRDGVNMEDFGLDIQCSACNGVVATCIKLKEASLEDRIVPSENVTVPDNLPEIDQVFPESMDQDVFMIEMTGKG